MTTPAAGSLISQLTPLGKRLLSKGSRMAAAVAPMTMEDGKPRYRRLTVRAQPFSPIGADPRVFSLVNPFRAADSPVQVVVVGSKQSAEYWSERVLEAAQHDRVVGVDLEWKPVFTKGAGTQKAALIQVSVKGMTLLVQLSKLGYVPGPLLKLLGDSTLVKVGVCVEGDLNILMKGHKVECNGYHDVGLATPRILEKGADALSLKRVVEQLYGFTLEKNKRVRMSNWESVVLTDQQVEYAAMDALVGRETYLELLARGEMDEKHLEGLMRQWVATDPRRARALSRETAKLRDLFKRLGGGEEKRPAAVAAVGGKGGEGERPAKKARVEPVWEIMDDEELVSPPSGGKQDGHIPPATEAAV